MSDISNIRSFPLSSLQRERKDDKAMALRKAVEDIFCDRDPRWSDAELLSIHLSTQDLKKFLMSLKAPANA